MYVLKEEEAMKDALDGQWAECTNPARAAELFLVLDYMAGYLDDEVQRTYWKV